jgi:hypothetical protein
MSRFGKLVRYVIAVPLGMFVGCIGGYALSVVVITVCSVIVQPVQYEYFGSALVAGIAITSGGAISGGVVAARWVHATNP